MKHLLLTSCFFLGASALASAQDIRPGKPDSLFESRFKKYVLSKKNNTDLSFKHQSILPTSPEYTEERAIDHMPNAYPKQPQLTYLGHNNKGFSLYQSGIDNLYVLKPDSSFASAMPVK